MQRAQERERSSISRESEDVLFNLSFAVKSTGKSYPPLTPHTFSFNSPEGMCLDCQGLGYQYGADLARNREVMQLSIIGLLRHLWTTTHIVAFELFLKKEGIDPHAPLEALTDTQLQLLLNGDAEGKWMVSKERYRFRWLGIQPILAKAGKVAHTELRAPLIPLLDEVECLSCKGTRLHPLARHVRIHQYTLPCSVSSLLRKLSNFSQLHLPPKGKTA